MAYLRVLLWFELGALSNVLLPLCEIDDRRQLPDARFDCAGRTFPC